MDSINWIKKIAEHYKILTTWLVDIDGIKCIAKKIAISDKGKILEVSQKLRREVRFSEILNSDEQKGICLFDKIIEEDDGLILIRKWCDGIPLNEFLAQHRLQISESVDLLIKIASIVQLAHAHNIVHGDLTPSNIIVYQENITIVDWDTITIGELLEKSGLIESQIIGNAAYMPIEQFKGSQNGMQCDVYSLGIILYYILVGKTPFDGLKTPEDIVRYKGIHEPENISSKYPAIGIPEELSRIIENSLKNDRNQRIQNVSDLINKLRLIGKIAVAIRRPKPNPDETRIEPNIKEEHKLVLIGHTGAGKTVFAAGLYATQDKDFSVDDPGNKSQTGIHAINIKTIIEDGEWPAATSIGDITRLRFKINYKGYEENISFDEYAGERLNMPGSDKLIGKPDGAFILLNPGGPQWWNTREKNVLISDIKYYIGSLSKMDNNPPIALVITASDRLESDLKNRAAIFNKYIDEIITALEQRHCNYKTFYVSVSGKLEDQNKPKLNPHHIKDPFIWMIKQFIAKSQKKKFKRCLSGVLIFAATLAVAAGMEFAREMYRNSSLESEFLSVQTEYINNPNKSGDSILDYRNKLVEVRNKDCLQSHIDNTKRIDNCTDECKPFFIYPMLKTRHEDLISEIEKTIDSANYEYFRSALASAIGNANMENRKIVKEIKDWTPLFSDFIGEKEDLLHKAENEMPVAIERFDKKELLGKFQKLVNNPQTKIPQELIVEYDRLLSLKTHLSPAEYNNGISALKEALNNAKKSCEDKHYNDLIKELKNIKDEMPEDIYQKLKEWEDHETVYDGETRKRLDKNIVDECKNACIRVFDSAINDFNRKLSNSSLDINKIVDVFKDLNNLKNKSFIGIEKFKIEEAISGIEKRSYSKLDDYIDSEKNKHLKKILQSDEFEDPKYEKTLKEQLIPLLPKSKQEEYDKKLKNANDDICKKWDIEKRKEIDNFKSRLNYANCEQTLDNLKEFYLEHREHPYLKEAEDFVLKEVKQEIEMRLDNWDNSEKSYRSLKELCAKIRSTPSQCIIESPYYKFANNYFNWMSNGDPTIEVNISKIYALSSYSEGAYISDLYYKKSSETQYTTLFEGKDDRSSIFYNGWISLPYFRGIKVQCKPWEYIYIAIQPYENIEYAIDKKLEIQYVIIDTKKKKYANNVPISDGRIEMKFDFTITGKTIDDVLEESSK